MNLLNRQENPDHRVLVRFELYISFGKYQFWLRSFRSGLVLFPSLLWKWLPSPLWQPDARRDIQTVHRAAKITLVLLRLGRSKTFIQRVRNTSYLITYTRTGTVESDLRPTTVSVYTLPGVELKTTRLGEHSLAHRM